MNVVADKQRFDSYESMKLQRETRGSLLQHHLRFYRKYLLGAVPILSRNLSEVPPETSLQGVSRRNDIALRSLLYVRGLLRSNDVGTALGRLYMTRLLAEVAAHNEPATPTPVPIWQWQKDGGPDEFYAHWVRRPHPVIIKGMQMRALNWSVKSLVDRFATVPVIFSDKNDNHFEAPLGNLLSEPEHYVHNCGRLFVEYPELMEEMDLGLLEPYMKARGPVGQLFLGNRRKTGTRFHCAGNFNLFFQLEGRKRWWFIDPNHLLFMYPWLSATNVYQASLIGIPRDSDVDEQYPLFRYCPRLIADLEPGDVLLNPPWWYHAIDNVTETTTAMATRWFPPDMVDTNRLYSCLQTEPRFLLHILRKFIAARKRGDRPNAWLIFEDTAHDNSLNVAGQPASRRVWF